MPPVRSAAIPWMVANRTSPTRSGSPGSSRPSAWPWRIDLEHHREGSLRGLLQDARLFAVLDREHQLEQRRVRGGEADVGRRGRAQACLEVIAGRVDRGAQLVAEPVKAGLGQRVEQGLAIGKVAARGAVADADVAGELAQRQVLHAALADGALGRVQQSAAQIAMVIGTLGHRRSRG